MLPRSNKRSNPGILENIYNKTTSLFSLATSTIYSLFPNNRGFNEDLENANDKKKLNIPNLRRPGRRPDHRSNRSTINNDFLEEIDLRENILNQD